MPIPKKTITIPTPKDSNITVRNQGMHVTAQLKWANGFGQSRGKALMNAQEFIDAQCLRHMEPLTPRDTGVMIKSATINTTVGSGVIQYGTAYARRQYYENKGEGMRGRLWFERMKASHAEEIRKGAEEIAGK